ncbi:MAG TPA: hypothetical protein VJY33_01665 [Isosphaeraceae bacterium]|nr:hypothetical protein [Isosphaeraceae bacterium]
MLDAIKALDSFLENRRGVPVAIEAATNGRAIEPPADRPELATAPPLENLVPEVPDYVTLSQAAKMVKKSKRTLEGDKSKGSLPAPVVNGGGGCADLYDWAVMRPWLSERFGWHMDRLPLIHPETAALRAGASDHRPPKTAENRRNR